MPLIGPRTLADWLEADYANMHPTIDGGIENLKDNLAPNQYFQAIDAFNDAEGYPFELPPEAAAPTGNYFYASDVGKTSLRKQTGVPAPLQEAWDFTEPWLSEGTMPINNPQNAAFGSYRPPAPIVVSVAGGHSGYPAGTYMLYNTLVSKAGFHTLPSEHVTFSLTAGQGFRVAMPEGIQRGVRVGWWLTAPNGRKSTARLIRITRHGHPRETFTGYKGSQRLPSRNMTELSRPPKPRIGGGPDDMIVRAPGPDRLRSGDYRFSWARVTTFGTTRASAWSDIETVGTRRYLYAPVSFTASASNETFTATGHGYEVGNALEMRGSSLPAPLVSENTYFVVAVPDENTFRISSSPGGAVLNLTSNGSGNALKVSTVDYHLNQCFRISVPKQTPDAIGWVLSVQRNGTSYRVYRTNRIGGSSSHFTFHRPQRIEIDGAFESSDPSRERRFSYTQQEPPDENTSGIEPPSSPPDTPIPFQASTSLAPTGKRRYAYAEVVQDGRGGEKISMCSPVIEHTTAAGEYVRVIPPDPNNIFPNAEGRELGSSGVPFNSSVFGTNGRYYWQDGKHVITTDNTAYASDTVFWEFNLQEVNTSQTHCFRGMLEATITAGTARVELQERDAAGTLLAATLLRSIASSGTMPFERRFGPNGDQAWNANTVSVRMALLMAGATRNMTAKAYHLAGHPYPMAPRRIEQGEAYQPTSFDGVPETPFPRGVQWHIGAAPATSFESQAQAPLDDINFNNAAALPPTGWLHHSNLAISEIATVSGTRVWRIADNTQSGSAEAYLRKDFTAIDGERIAVRVIQDTVRVPGGTGNLTEYLRLSAWDGASYRQVGFLHIHSDYGGLRLQATDRNGNSIHEYSGFRLSAGDAFDYEVLASGAGTQNGILTLLAGKNGADRSIVAQLTGLDWRNYVLRRVLVGCPSESNPLSRWGANVHRVKVTESGDAIGKAAEPPSGEAVPLPDRPTLSFPAWTAKTAIALNAERVPATTNNHYYRATVAGTTGPNEPAFPTNGATVVDNAGLVGVARSTVYAVGNSVLAPVPTTTEWYEATAVAGTATTAATAPAYPTTAGATVVDGEVTFTCRKTVTWQDMGDVFISHDANGQTINQGYLFVPMYYGENRFDVENVARFAVVPGKEYVKGIRSRHVVPVGHEGTQPWFWELYNPTTSATIPVGSPYGTGLSGTAGWADHTISTGVVPEGYTELRGHFRNVGPCMYICQDIASSQGTALKRGYGVAGSGWFRTRLDSRTPYGAACFRQLIKSWKDIEVVSEIPDGASVVPAYEHSNDLVTWQSFDPVMGMPDATFARIYADVTTSPDGKTPYIPPEGAHLLTSPAKTLLLRSDRSELPGGANLDGLELPATRSRFDVDEVGGHRVLTDLTEPVTWTTPFTIEVYTENAKQELEENWDQDWIVEAPYLLGGTGALLTIRFSDVVTLEELNVPRDYVDGVRKVWAKAEDVEAEVLEIVPL